MSLDLISNARGMGIASAPKQHAVIAALVEAAARRALPEGVDTRLLQTELSYDSEGQGMLTALARVKGSTHVDVLSRPRRDIVVPVAVTDETGARVASAAVHWRLRAVPAPDANDGLRFAI